MNKVTIDLSGAVNISDLGIKITSFLDEEGSNNKELYLNLGNIDLKQSQLLSIKALIEAMQSKLAGVETTSEMTEASAVGLGIFVGKPQQNSVNVEQTSFSEAFNKQEQANVDEINSFAQLKKVNSIGDFITDTQSLDEVKDENVQEEVDSFLKEAQEEDDDSSEEDNKEFNIYEELQKAGEPVTDSDIQSALDITFGAREIADEVKVEEKSDSNNEEDVFAPIQIQEKFEEHEVTETSERSEEGKYVLLDTEGITPEGVELIKANTSDLDTLYLTQTLRSGQTVSYEGNIFLIGDAHPGSEINATGDITVWGILGGIVHAGSKGNTDAKVRALKLNPIQLRIANLYSRRNDTINVPYVQKSNEFTPEEARIENEKIVIYKTLRRED
ncbi:septum site-determining protein MinC [bacterium]|nr:septum site-determining protein MinC [bacterium]